MCATRPREELLLVTTAGLIREVHLNNQCDIWLSLHFLSFSFAAGSLRPQRRHLAAVGKIGFG